ncbi:hypothetical protein HaLaN_07571 [Haematococcus lacustris]|uniref:Uncharacterized protein n=1 Tax=Haematococcus lacustris TaxID=44745 RepID=A0A699YNW3_HAELA|nr:hypothetical protein HaLaN_07571 [Haematococcus lacustris]
MVVPGLKPVAPSTLNHRAASRDGPVERDGGGRKACHGVSVEVCDGKHGFSWGQVTYAGV